jgi:prolipoprotein diacylglyceryltransferase
MTPETSSIMWLLHKPAALYELVYEWILNIILTYLHVVFWRARSRFFPGRKELTDSFLAFYGTRRFNAEFTRALHLFLSWARPIQSTSPHPTSPRSILILFTHLVLVFLAVSFPLAFPPITYTRYSSPPFVPWTWGHLLIPLVLHSFQVTWLHLE